ncbi:MAG: hypothetical protein R3F50_08010 [Gammaproteobacteria bacterium]
MKSNQSSLGRFAQQAFRTTSFTVVVILLALPLTRAFADDFRNDRGRNFYGAVTVEGWRLGGAYRQGGYEIWRWTRGGWRRMPGRGVQLGGNPRNPWVINSQGERYHWTGGGWRQVGYANGRGFNGRGNIRPPVFRNDRGRNDWYSHRGYRNDRNGGRRDNRRNVVERQRDRIEWQQDRIQDLRQDLRQERREDRVQDRRDDRRNDRDRNRTRDDQNDRNGRRDGDRDRQGGGRRQ